MNRREFLHPALLLPVAAPAIMAAPRARAAVLAPGGRKPLGPPRATAATFELNPQVAGVRCLRCQKLYPMATAVADTGTGCPVCLAEGYPVNVTFSYEAITRGAFDRRGSGMRRYRELLPFLDFPTLGEGDTPLLPLGVLARKLGLAALYAKDESRGPTGSHKDRTSGLVIARAHQLERPGVVAASSGNGGHSLAAYAGAAGIRCTILSTKKLSGPWRQAIEATGATLRLTETPNERWVIMKDMVEKEGWYPFTNYILPPVGSNPFAVQGCKTIAYELVEQLGAELADALVVPTCRGDLLWGIYEGFAEARQAQLISRIPRLYAVEPFPRLQRILAGEDYRTSFAQPEHSLVSIGTPTSAYQAVCAVTQSRGGACSVTTQEAIQAQGELASLGLYLELSSAAALAGLYALVARQAIGPGERVVLVCTSHGYKELRPPA